MEYHIYIPSQLAAALKSSRKARGVTQQLVASQVGLLPKTVSALENSPDTSSIESLFKLLSALGLEMVLRTKDDTPSGEW